MKDHDWVDEAPGSEGTWSQCSGCGKRVFFSSGWNSFQRRLTVTMAWLDDVSSLPKEDKQLLESNRPLCSSSPDAPDVKVGLHGLLSQDCDFAALFESGTWLVMLR